MKMQTNLRRVTKKANTLLGIGFFAYPKEIRIIKSQQSGGLLIDG